MISRSIGEGAFGVVYRGYYKKTGETTEMRVAIKVSTKLPKDISNMCVWSEYIMLEMIELIHHCIQYSIGVVSDSGTEKRHDQCGGEIRRRQHA